MGLLSAKYILKYNRMKKLLTLVICIFILTTLAGCNGVTFSDIKIVADDVYDVPVGEYTLRYSIPDFEKYNEKFNLTVKVTAFGLDDKQVPVENNRTIKVAIDCVYTVNVAVSAIIDGENKQTTKTFTVSAVKTSPVVTFTVGSKDYIKKTVPYGSSLDISEFEQIPDLYTQTGSGVNQTILSKKWVITVNGKTYDLVQEHLNNITTDLNIKAQYTYSVTYGPVTVSFENGDGATETPSITQTANSEFRMPDYPVRTGYVFDGWYTDREYTKIFSWKNTKTVWDDTVLYAKWIENDYSEYAEYFEFSEPVIDNYGYSYYKARLNRKTSYPADIAVPAGYAGLPVKAFYRTDIETIHDRAMGAFEETAVESVIVPKAFLYLDSQTFKNCVNLKTVTFDGSFVTDIGTDTFFGCASLQSITIPDGVTRIGQNAFKGCSSLTSVTLPSTLTVIHVGAFDDCAALVSITIPDSVKQLNSCFGGCTALTTVTFTAKSKLSFIASDTFDGCSSLKEITLPYALKDNSSVKETFKKLGVTVNFYDKPEEENG